MPQSFTKSGLAAVNNSVRAVWRERYSVAQENLPWRRLTTDLGKSPTKSQQLDWFGAVMDMRDVAHGPVESRPVGRFNYTIDQKEYAAELKVRIVDLMTDNLTQIQPRIDGLARKAASHPGRLAFDQLEANPAAYDAITLFNDTRAFGAAANIDNDLAGTGTTNAQIEADIATMRSTQMRFENDLGEVEEIAPDTLIIPPERSSAFKAVLGPIRTPENVGTGVIPPALGNVWQGGGYTVLELGRLTDTDNWYGAHTGGELLPFIYTWVQEPEPLNEPSMNDETAKRGYLEYVVYGVYNVGVSLPQYMVRVVN